MGPYSCFNRAAPHAALLVQDGWQDYPVTLIDSQGNRANIVSRLPVMRHIPNVFAGDTECRYDAKKNDKRCTGCQHAVQV